MLQRTIHLTRLHAAFTTPSRKTFFVEATVTLPIEPDNVDLVAAHLASAMLGGAPRDQTASDRAKLAVDTYHQIRDALVQSEMDRGHSLMDRGVANGNRAHARPAIAPARQLRG